MSVIVNFIRKREVFKLLWFSTPPPPPLQKNIYIMAVIFPWIKSWENSSHLTHLRPIFASWHLPVQSQQWSNVRNVIHVRNMFKLQNYIISYIILVSLLLTLIRFSTFSWFFHCWLGSYRLGSCRTWLFQRFQK